MSKTGLPKKSMTPTASTRAPDTGLPDGTAVTVPNTKVISARAGPARPIASRRPAATDPARACLNISISSRTLENLAGVSRRRRDLWAPLPPGRVFTPRERLFSAAGRRVPRNRHAHDRTCSSHARRQAAYRILRGAGAGDRPQVASRDRPAVGVGEAEPGDAPSRAPVLDDHGLVTPAEDPLVRPLPKRRQHGQQRLALLGQAILEALALRCPRPRARRSRDRRDAGAAP